MNMYIILGIVSSIIIVGAILGVYIYRLKAKIKELEKQTKDVSYDMHTYSVSEDDMKTIPMMGTDFGETGTVLLNTESSIGTQQLESSVPDNVKVGDLLKNRYRIDKVLGSGAQGKVYVCTNIELGNQWAVKHFSGSMNEKDILVKLNHMSLPKIADLFEDKKGVFIIESLIDGRSLSDLQSKEEEFQENDVISWMIQLCEALQYIHNKNILHMDIKPQNILITEDYKAMLIDFGIATHIEKEDETHRIYGYSPVFSSPEQEGGLSKIDERSDLYALGATFYYIFSKLSPKTRTYIKDVCPFLSDELASIIHRCIEVDPSMRFYTAKELKESLLDLQNMSTRINKNTTIHIGVMGTCVGVGVTHTAFLCANVLARKKYKVAIVEKTDLNCFKYLVEKERIDSTDVFATLNQIDIYEYQDNATQLQALYRKNYDYIFYDYGSMTMFGEAPNEERFAGKQELFAEFLRSDRKIVVVGTELWQIDGVKILYERQEVLNNKNFVFAFPINDSAKSFSKDFRRAKCVDVPMCKLFEKSTVADQVVNKIIN